MVLVPLPLLGGFPPGGSPSRPSPHAPTARPSPVPRCSLHRCPCRFSSSAGWAGLLLRSVRVSGCTPPLVLHMQPTLLDSRMVGLPGLVEGTSRLGQDGGPGSGLRVRVEVRALCWPTGPGKKKCPVASFPLLPTLNPVLQIPADTHNATPIETKRYRRTFTLTHPRIHTPLHAHAHAHTLSHLLLPTNKSTVTSLFPPGSIHLIPPPSHQTAHAPPTFCLLHLKTQLAFQTHLPLPTWAVRACRPRPFSWHLTCTRIQPIPPTKCLFLPTIITPRSFIHPFIHPFIPSLHSSSPSGFSHIDSGRRSVPYYLFGALCSHSKTHIQSTWVPCTCHSHPCPPATQAQPPHPQTAAAAASIIIIIIILLHPMPAACRSTHLHLPRSQPPSSAQAEFFLHFIPGILWPFSQPADRTFLEVSLI